MVSPTFGLKGRADAVRRGMPVELKTGKNTNREPRFHDKVQAACYALLLRERGVEADTATLIVSGHANLLHDVKAVEYFVKQSVESLGLGDKKEFVHFGLTSQDINNTAVPMAFRDYLGECYFPAMDDLHGQLRKLADKWKGVPMLAHTHGQPASPTTAGKELGVFVEGLHEQLGHLQGMKMRGKFGGATGNFNAHIAAYPNHDWVQFANAFLEHHLGLKRQQTTTQIAHYDELAAHFDAMRRINVILMDLARDLWMYISMDYFGQRINEQEVGSSAMPHKVNPIDFENAEGNLGLANALFDHLSNKLPTSRLQRDLTDSTVTRNIGVPCAHTTIAVAALTKGLSKLTLNEQQLAKDLQDNWMVVAEAIQTLLRREGYAQPYEALKALTRQAGKTGKEAIHRFIDELDVEDSIKEELKAITPENYLGNAGQ
jgi:adenylosuccinate lyase